MPRPSLTLEPEHTALVIIECQNGVAGPAKINQALTKLTPRERMVFELKHYQGLRLRTIGEMLNTTEETAKNTLFRATQKLRGALADMR